MAIPGNPIPWTAQTKSPGTWRGIQAQDGSQAAVVNFDYVIIEHSACDLGGANIELQNAMLIAHHSTISYSLEDGVRSDLSSHGSLPGPPLSPKSGYLHGDCQRPTPFINKNDRLWAYNNFKGEIIEHFKNQGGNHDRGKSPDNYQRRDIQRLADSPRR